MVKINIVIALIVFTIIVFVHELGHFLFAKKNGILVEEFAIGMGPKIISKKVGETVYSIRALPLGGFCSMLGENEEINDEKSFGSKSVLARMSVIAAGPFMNFLLAFIILLIFSTTSGYTLPVVSELIPEYNADTAGLQVGDKITRVDNRRVHIAEDVNFYMSVENTGQDVELEIIRDNKKQKLTVKPVFNEKAQRWLIGFQFTHEKGNVLHIIANSFWEIIFYIKMTVISFVKIVTGQVSTNNIAGPIGIVNIIGESYEIGIRQSIMAAIANIASMIVLLSANLGALNLFPIPALDGSRLVFLGLEGIRRKPVNQKVEAAIHMAGLTLLMLFMIYVSYNDVVRWISGG